MSLFLEDKAGDTRRKDHHNDDVDSWSPTPNLDIKKRSPIWIEQPFQNLVVYLWINSLHLGETLWLLAPLSGLPSGPTGRTELPVFVRVRFRRRCAKQRVGRRSKNHHSKSITITSNHQSHKPRYMVRMVCPSCGSVGDHYFVRKDLALTNHHHPLLVAMWPWDIARR